MTRLVLVPLLALAVAFSACTKKPDTPPVPKVSNPAQRPMASAAAPATAAQADDGIAWRRGDVDAAFVEAKAANKPVFLYWGAGWCPPCNQMKATLFSKREFVERTQFFVPVYIDGDTPAAQGLGTRFSVSGYPTMVLFKPDGTEITRLPGEADPERYLQMLTIGMNSARPVRETLATALADGRGLVEDDWRMLAWYAWDTDDQQLVPMAEVPATLHRLATRCPPGYVDTHARLTLKTAAAVADRDEPTSGKRALTFAIDRKASLAEIETVLSKPVSVRANFDMLANDLPGIVRVATAPRSPERARLLIAADRALAQLENDPGLSDTDRLGALEARVGLATIDVPPSAAQRKMAPLVLSPALRDDVKRAVARADHDSRNPYQRQTVINAAASVLTAAGMLDDSDALLRAELTKSHFPYYFMLDLAANAKKRGDPAAAIGWYAQAYDAAKGPATRLQWGATYVNALIDLAPDDATRIEEVADQVLGEVEPVATSFDGRNRKSLSRLTDRIAAWSAKGGHADAAKRIAETSQKLCDRIPAGATERLQCDALLKVGSPLAGPAGDLATPSTRGT